VNCISRRDAEAQRGLAELDTPLRKVHTGQVKKLLLGDHMHVSKGQPRGGAAALPESPRQPLDLTPPPDHEGFVEASADGLRAIRERREKRRRKK